jgi:predicted ATPase
LAGELGHGFSLADVLCFAGCVFNHMRRDARVLERHAGELTRLSQEMGFSSFEGTGTCYGGVALSKVGEVQEGLDQLRAGMAARELQDARCYSTGIMGALGEALALTGEPQAGLATLDEALDLVEETDERYCQAELHRLRAELLLAEGAVAKAEADLYRAIEVARSQNARSWELRATTSLARLWQNQGKGEEARQMLVEIYSWFKEGFDTPDLLEARALLNELSSA